VRFGLRLFAVPHINEMAVRQLEVMRHAHYIECASFRVACCRICILNVCVAGYFLKSSEFLSCFQKAPNYSFIVLQNFHWNVVSPLNDRVFGESILCGFVTARQLGYVTRTHRHTSHRLKSPSTYRRVYALFCSRTCIWCDTLQYVDYISHR